MKKNHTITKMMIMFLAFILAGSVKVFSENRYSASITVRSDNPDTPYDDINGIPSKHQKGEELVSSVEELELPLRQKDYGKYYDDFNRLVANEIRPDAKKLYLEQEKAKEITSLEDAVMPLIKKGGLTERDYYHYNYYVRPDYETNSALNKYPVAFYDSLGRKISDDLIVEASKVFDKQQRHKELSDWTSTSVSEIWYGIWGLVKLIIILMIVFFAANVFYKKVIKKV